MLKKRIKTIDSKLLNGPIDEVIDKLRGLKILHPDIEFATYIDHMASIDQQRLIVNLTYETEETRTEKKKRLQDEQQKLKRIDENIEEMNANIEYFQNEIDKLVALRDENK